MSLTQVFICFLIVWTLSIITFRTIEIKKYNSKQAKQKQRDTDLAMYQKDKLINFYRTQAETRDI